MTLLAPHLSRYLLEYLPRDRHCSQHTIDAYAYSFQLLVCYAATALAVRPSKLEVEQLSVPLILSFLDELERKRGNSIRTRNARLAAYKSFFRYLEYRAPACLALSMQVHAVPGKKCVLPLIDYLNRTELQAILDAPNPGTSIGLRDRAMLHLAYAAGLRVSELIALTLDDLSLPGMDTVHVLGKGRRERVLPLWKETRRVMKDWLNIRPVQGDPEVFLNHRKQTMSRHGFAQRLKTYVIKVSEAMPSLVQKNVTPHTLRHTCAMHTLEATGDIRKVSLWLGHSTLQSTEIYLHVDPVEKLGILKAGVPPQIQKGTFTGVSDKLLDMLNEARAT